MPRVSGVDDARNSAVPAVAPQHDASERAPLLARLTNWIRWPQGPRAIAFGKLLRTTAFKLTLVYLTVFALFAASLLGYFAFNTRRLITDQITRTVNAEVTGLTQQFNSGCIRRLVLIVVARARRPGSSL